MINLAFYWHQHQPYYPDDISGENLMPWVRLHGVKDYYGMAMHLKEVPEMACTINLVPSLLIQLQAYTERGATDKPLDVSRVHAGGLSKDDCLYLLDNFFMASLDQMIRPYPRYFELYQRRALGKIPAEQALPKFTEGDLRDLQVLFNLAWIHPIAFEQDSALEELRRKARGFTEDDKQWLLDKHLSLLREIIPLHQDLARSGQVELTTTPFFHPILPLLLDKRSAREAIPDASLPRHTEGYVEDVEYHIREAVALHTGLFGEPPLGMWPAEGSVSQTMIPFLTRQGIEWIATDEEILSCSTQGFVSRDDLGQMQNPSRMYCPYRIREGNDELTIVFRDHTLSDLIGFHYQRSDPIAAADDFLGQLLEINRGVDQHQPALVSVILDGENCWEHYPGGGVEFLRTLYQRCIQHPDVHPVRVGQYVREHPPRDSLPRLFAGSWIGHNFSIWIGHDEDNSAWDLLHNTREHLLERVRQGHLPQERLEQAWRELYIAEGSDWFWWYGDDHSSLNDNLFDYLFRKHLQNVYLILGETPPKELATAIKQHVVRSSYTSPRNFLDVAVTGRYTFFEWLGAGRYQAQREHGTMAGATYGPIKDVYFGFDLGRLLIRVDFDQPARKALIPYDAIRVTFQEPSGWQLSLNRAPKTTNSDSVLEYWPALSREGRPQGIGQAQTIEVGIDKTLEVALPFDLLPLGVGDPFQFFLEVLQGSQSRDRAPRDGAIAMHRPSRDFEQLMWQV
ncbi:MAG: alpha-amylase/alpha-mannosidase [Gemmataceae bacterium]